MSGASTPSLRYELEARLGEDRRSRGGGWGGPGPMRWRGAGPSNTCLRHRPLADTRCVARAGMSAAELDRQISQAGAAVRQPPMSPAGVTLSPLSAARRAVPATPFARSLPRPPLAGPAPVTCARCLLSRAVSSRRRLTYPPFLARPPFAAVLRGCRLTRWSARRRSRPSRRRHGSAWKKMRRSTSLSARTRCGTRSVRCGHLLGLRARVSPT